MKSDATHHPRVCVLLATYNGAAYLQEQLDSIQSQKNCQCVIIARDDGSSDGTISILNQNKVHILQGKAKQLGAAMNFFHLLKEFAENYVDCDFDYVALADQDDIWLPHKISRALIVLDGGYDCYSSGFFEYSMKSGVWVRGRKVKKHFEIRPLSYLSRSPGPGFTYVFKASFITRIVGDKLFQNMFIDNSVVPRWHDWALFAFADKLKASWFIDDWASSLYRLHNQNHTGVLSYRNWSSRFRFFFDGSFYREMIKIAYIGSDNDAYRRLIRRSLQDRIFFIMRVNDLRSKIVDKIFLIILFLTVK